MSNIKRIRKVPVVVDNRHESIYRSWFVLQYVMTLLEDKTPPSVILEIINTCYEDELPSIKEKTWEEMAKNE